MTYRPRPGMMLKEALLKTLNEDGPQTVVELKERMEQAVAASLMRARGRGVQAALWELRRDGKVERDDEGGGYYTALVKPDAPRQALGGDRQEVNLHCQGCRHEWQERIELPMAIEAALARMRGWCTCPNCGSDDHVYIGEMKRHG